MHKYILTCIHHHHQVTLIAPPAFSYHPSLIADPLDCI